MDGGLLSTRIQDMQLARIAESLQMSGLTGMHNTKDVLMSECHCTIAAVAVKQASCILQATS